VVYRDAEVLTTPSPSGGPIVSAILSLLSGFDMGAMGQQSANALHLVAEA